MLSSCTDRWIVLALALLLGLMVLGGACHSDPHACVALVDEDGDGYFVEADSPPVIVTPPESCPDGYGSLEDADCDDTSAEISPDAEEVCGNDVDENCTYSLDDDCE